VIMPLVFGGGWPYPTTGQWALWSFTVNFAHPTPYGFAHFWSLAVEEQFYLVWPFVVYCATSARLAKVCLLLALGALILLVGLVVADALPWHLYTSTLCRMDALAMGGLAACLMRVTDIRMAIARRADLVGLGVGAVLIIGGIATHAYNRDRWPCETYGYSV